MGIQSKERQDELFDLRVNQARLFYALAIAIGGGPGEQRQAKEMLLEFASDPLTAKSMLRAIPPELEDRSEAIIEAVAVARRTLSPRPPLLEANV